MGRPAGSLGKGAGCGAPSFDPLLMRLARCAICELIFSYAPPSFVRSLALASSLRHSRPAAARPLRLCCLHGHSRTSFDPQLTRLVRCAVSARTLLPHCFRSSSSFDQRTAQSFAFISSSPALLASQLVDERGILARFVAHAAHSMRHLRQHLLSLPSSPSSRVSSALQRHLSQVRALKSRQNRVRFNSILRSEEVRGGCEDPHRKMGMSRGLIGVFEGLIGRREGRRRGRGRDAREEEAR